MSFNYITQYYPSITRYSRIFFTLLSKKIFFLRSQEKDIVDDLIAAANFDNSQMLRYSESKKLKLNEKKAVNL